MHPPDSLSVAVHVGKQLHGVDTEVVRRIGPHLVRPPLEQRLGPDQVPVLEVVVCGTDLDQPLEEQLRLAVFPFPEILQDFVGLEEVFLVEQADAFLDRVEAQRFGFHPSFNVREGRESTFPRGGPARVPSRKTLSAPTRVHEARAKRKGPSESGTADAGTPASERAFAIVRPSKRGPDSNTYARLTWPRPWATLIASRTLSL